MVQECSSEEVAGGGWRRFEHDCLVPSSHLYELVSERALFSQLIEGVRADEVCHAKNGDVDSQLLAALCEEVLVLQVSGAVGTCGGRSRGFGEVPRELGSVNPYRGEVEGRAESGLGQSMEQVQYPLRVGPIWLVDPGTDDGN